MSGYAILHNGEPHQIAYLGDNYAIPDTVVVYNNPIYVDGSVEATGDGTKGSPYKSISEAAAVAVPGETVVIRGGVYFEHVTPANSGTAGNPITYVMETAPDGSPLVHIIGGDTVASWTHDPALGFAVYKTNSVGYDPKTLTIDGNKRVPKLAWKPADGNAAPGSPYEDRNMFSYIGLPADHQFELYWNKGNTQNGPVISFWDGLGGAFGYDSGTTYVKFADGTDPNTLDIRVAPDDSAGFDLTGKSYITIQGGKIAGGEYGVQLSGVNCHHNIIEDCEILTGAVRVNIQDNAHSNLIRNNEIHQGLLDTDYLPGPWSHGNPANLVYEQNIAQRIYEFHKYLGSRSSYSSSDCGGIQFRYGGDGNEVYGNHINNLLTCVDYWYTGNLKIHGNHMHNTSSGVIVQAFEGQNVEIYDNLMHEGNFMLRSQENQQELNKSIYFYRNRCWNPDMRGSSHVYMHYSTQRTEAIQSEDEVHVWIYHNSFAGEHRPFAAGNVTGMGNMKLINNVLSSNTNVLDTDSNLGLFAYNWCAGFLYDNPYAPWWDSSNINRKNQQLWDDETVIPDFQLPVGHEAREAGKDVSAPFTIDSVQYPALPGFSSGYYSGSAPNMGYLQ